MWQLHQYPLCPFSRKIRFQCAEKGVSVELVREHPWERRDAFLLLNPAGQTPVLVEGSTTLIDSCAIAEYLEETVDRTPLMGSGAAERAETRRLTAWFDQKFYGEVVAPLLAERMWKRLITRGAPDAGTIRAAQRQAESHLDYIDYLLGNSRWLAGPVFSLADITAASQLSVADYLGGLDWEGHEESATWYAAIKSRPTFRPMLSDRMEGLPPPAHYDKLDF
ncbi:glutathione S-transferase family protein [Sphingosinicellaceae bacterium]|nr:glutathione S-transferase family protein [Sphingosinicellaceae bacterium]